MFDCKDNTASPYMPLRQGSQTRSPQYNILWPAKGVKGHSFIGR